MLTEDHLVPYKPSPLPLGPWLVLAPHPDDETIGLGGTLALGAQKGLEIRVIFVTDGEVGGDPFRRRQEATCALKALGDLRSEFWNLPDRAVDRELETLSQRLKRLKVHRFRTVFLPSFMEFHPDHRAVTWGALAFLREVAFQGEVWLSEISRQAEVNRLVAVDEVWPQKEEALACYESQLAQAPYRELAISLACLRAYTLSPLGIRRAEGFFAARLDRLLKDWGEALGRYLR